MNSRKILLFTITPILILAWLLSVAIPEPIMVEKNLFSSDRKPTTDESPAAETPGKAPAQTGLPPKSVQLDGIFIREDVKKALVRVSSQILGESSKGRGKRDPFPYMSISEGESIGDFKVLKIDSRSVSLEKDNQVYVISLFMDGKVVPPAATLPAEPISPDQEKSPQGTPGSAAPNQAQPQQAANNTPQPSMPPAPPSPAGGNPPTAPPGMNNLPMPSSPPTNQPGNVAQQQ